MSGFCTGRDHFDCIYRTIGLTQSAPCTFVGNYRKRLKPSFSDGAKYQGKPRQEKNRYESIKKSGIKSQRDRPGKEPIDMNLGGDSRKIGDSAGCKRPDQPACNHNHNNRQSIRAFDPEVRLVDLQKVHKQKPDRNERGQKMHGGDGDACLIGNTKITRKHRHDLPVHMCDIDKPA